MFKNLVLTAGLAAVLIGVSPPAAQSASAGVKIGVLSCKVNGGWGYVLGSSRRADCNYTPIDGLTEYYTGDITKFGVDIGYTQGGTLVWGVIAPSSDVEAGALAGVYGGVTAGASLGVGLGANAMLGGFRNSIALQPLSLEGNAGVNLAAGVGSIRLSHTPA
jgi:hypothetical protein